MIIDTALFSRVQFGFATNFHILFPALSIGLALFLFIMGVVWMNTTITGLI
jgi:cytochrome d ubiquinol oxidase subunit I